MSEQENQDKKARKEAIEAAKARQNQDGEFDHIEKVAAIEPKTFQEKSSNFWYHYRLHVILAIFGVIVLSILTFSWLSTREENPTFTVVSSLSFQGSSELIKTGLTPLIKAGANPSKDVDITVIQVEHGTGEMTPEQTQMNRSKLLGVLSDGEHFLFMLDEDNYNDVKEVGMDFAPLNGVLENQNDRIVNDKYMLKGSEFSRQTQLEATLDDMFLCIANVKPEELSNNRQKIYYKDLALFNAIVEQK